MILSFKFKHIFILEFSVWFLIQEALLRLLESQEICFQLTSYSIYLKEYEKKFESLTC